MEKIDQIHSELFTYRLDKPIGGSGVSKVDVLWIEARTSDGVVGTGFSYVIGGGAAPLKDICQRLANHFLKNEPVPAPQAAWQKMVRSFNRTGRGWNFLALAALDMALWDIRAQVQQVPLGIAMGGMTRAVPVYASGPFQPGMDAEALRDVAAAACEAGYQGVKPRVAAESGEELMIAAVADVIPDSRSLMLDVNEKGDVARARRLLDCAKDHHVLFVEEPLPAWNLGGYRQLARTYGTLMATGEHLQGLTEFEPYIAGGMANILQPDLAMMGGLTPCLELATVAHFHGLTVAPHFLPGLFVHLAAACPAVTWLEDFPLLDPLFDGMPQMTTDGNMLLPDTPGHGLMLSDLAEHCR